MNTLLILSTSRRSSAGELSFGEVVGSLSQAGVEAYRADYVTLQSTYYGAEGAVIFAELTRVEATQEAILRLMAGAVTAIAA